MRDKVDEVIRMGIFADPRIIYHLSPAEMQAACDGYYAREAREEDRRGMYFGTVAAVICNTASGRKRNTKVFKASDFFERVNPQRAKQIEQDAGTMEDIARSITKTFGGAIRGSRR